MRKIVFTALLASLTMIIGIESAMACPCVPQRSPLESFQQAPVVFVGSVLSIKEEKQTFRRLGKFKTETVGVAARFLVEEPLKGISRREVEVVTGGGGFDFKENERYLVYAWPDEPDDADDTHRLSSTHPGGFGEHVQPLTLSTGICGRTRPLAYGLDDLSLIRALLMGRPETRIFGGLGVYAGDLCESGGCFPNEYGPLEGITVRAAGATATFETKTDSQGRYRFVNLPPGAYRVGIEMPEGLETLFDWDRGEIEIVLPQGCFGYEIEFSLQIAGRISGRLIDAEGNPVGKDVQVSLILAEDAALPMSRMRRMDEFTDEDGNYSFEAVPPGQYLLGVSIAEAPTIGTPYAKTYYPAGDDVSAAQVISLSKAERRMGLDLHLPPRLEDWPIEGVVVDRIGRPVPEARVELFDQENPGEELFETDAETDQRGRFTLNALKGRRYQVHAWKDQDYEAGTGKQSRLIAIDALAPSRPLRIVLNQPGIFIDQLPGSPQPGPPR